jgi:hypothetical protein
MLRPYQRTRCIQIAAMPLRVKLPTCIISDDKNKKHMLMSADPVRSDRGYAIERAANNFSHLR